MRIRHARVGSRVKGLMLIVGVRLRERAKYKQKMCKGKEIR